jgi:hypothetical protein
MTSVDQFLSQNVLCCVSYLVSDLAKMYGDRPQDPEILEEARELCSPVQDYKEAAIQAGWTGPYFDEFGTQYFECVSEFEGKMAYACSSWEELCWEYCIEPYEWEVFEHWVVTSWLGEKLASYGEKVGPLSDLTIWARTTTGQRISIDGVIQRIYNDTMHP